MRSHVDNGQALPDTPAIYYTFDFQLIFLVIVHSMNFHCCHIYDLPDIWDHNLRFKRVRSRVLFGPSLLVSFQGDG